LPFWESFYCPMTPFIKENIVNSSDPVRFEQGLFLYNKNGNFDTKLPFIFYTENAYIQGFPKIRKVALFFNV